MCLYTDRKAPFIADRDIKVYKHVRFCIDRICTPIYNMPVTLNTDLEPIEKTTYVASDGEIGAGAIHAYLWPNFKMSDKCVVAYIPKGTHYWFGRDNTSICAQKLHITDTIIYKDTVATMDSILAEESYTGAPKNIKGVKVGDVLVKDNLISPHEASMVSRYYHDGIVVGFNKGKPIIADLFNIIDDVRYCKTVHNYWQFEIISLQKAINDMNGEQHMHDLVNYLKTKPPIEVAQYEVYTNVRILSNRHYIPSLGEMRIMWKNIRYIAASCSIMSYTCPIYMGRLYWTSSEHSSTRCHTSSLWDSNLYSIHSVRTEYHPVIPFIALNDI